MTNSFIVQSNTEKINSFLQDVQYQSLMQSSANYNAKLSKDRKTRLPFLDSQTGIAQAPCKLFTSWRDRMPGNHDGQVFSYPAHRWCRKRRSYLLVKDHPIFESEIQDQGSYSFEKPTISGITDESSQSCDAKAPSDPSGYEPSLFLEEDDEADLDNEDNDSSYYVRSLSSSRRKKKIGKTKAFKARRKRLDKSHFKFITDADDDNPNKPYECALCGARYKTRQGLSYHLSHTHQSSNSSPSNHGLIKQTTNSTYSSDGNLINNIPPIGTMSNDALYSSSTFQPHPYVQPCNPYVSVPNFQESFLGIVGSKSAPVVEDRPDIIKQDSVVQSSSHALEKALQSDVNSEMVSGSKEEKKSTNLVSVPKVSTDLPVQPNLSSEKEKASIPQSSAIEIERESKRMATPNNYCDFCLGSTEKNAKTGQAEEMISCSDCGRAGHISCLQFTEQMACNVRQYRWQCIECKCCTVCGTSENDDKLLFCDTCDRGLHLYCVSPPLEEPPEGEWSCYLCIAQGKGKK